MYHDETSPLTRMMRLIGFEEYMYPFSATLVQKFPDIVDVTVGTTMRVVIPQPFKHMDSLVSI
jgi:hypothetical protein